MINGVIVKELKKYEDDRGYLIETYRRDEVDLGVAMSYLSLTLPSVARGPHEHVYQTDYFIFFPDIISVKFCLCHIPSLIEKVICYLS